MLKCLFFPAWCNMTNATTTEGSTAGTDQCDLDTITIFSDVNEYSQEMVSPAYDFSYYIASKEYPNLKVHVHISNNEKAI